MHYEVCVRSFDEVHEAPRCVCLQWATASSAEEGCKVEKERVDVLVLWEVRAEVHVMEYAINI